MTESTENEHLDDVLVTESAEDEHLDDVLVTDSTEDEHLDDELVTESTEDEHLLTLHRVLELLVQAGFRLKELRCPVTKSTTWVTGYMLKAYTLPGTPCQQFAMLRRPPT